MIIILQNGATSDLVVEESAMTLKSLKLPFSSWADAWLLYSTTAHFTPGTPRTRYRSFSVSGVMSSMNWTLGLRDP